MIMLDCTMRDGGYYNSWDFNINTVQKYMESMEKAGVDVIELGFRFPDQNKFLGPFAHLSDSIINSLPNVKCKIAVMINAADFINNKNNVKDYFEDCSKSPVDIVRIASHFRDIEESISLASDLKSLGYFVGFNIMQCSNKSDEELFEAGKIVQKNGNVDVLYLADSFGDMNKNNISRSYSSLRKSWNGECGFHAHNNKGKGVDNSMHALSVGVEWVDGTILGMGRGAGNAETEYLLTELSDDGFNYDSSEIWGLVLKEFSDLQSKYNWGPNLLYYLSASYRVHPTYVQELMDMSIDPVDIWQSLEYLRNSDGGSFSFDNMEKSQYGNINTGIGTWDATDFVKGKEVILIASGPKGKIHAKYINEYARNSNSFVIGLNIVDESFDVNAYAICHILRLATQMEEICKKGLPVISPISLLSEEVQEKFRECNFLDYGVIVKKDKFETEKNHCVIPSMLVFLYAMSAAIAGGASRILLVGFDGFERNDPRYDEMERVLSICNKSSTPIFAITPTIYNSISHKTVYCI